MCIRVEDYSTVSHTESWNTHYYTQHLFNKSRNKSYIEKRHIEWNRVFVIKHKLSSNLINNTYISYYHIIKYVYVINILSPAELMVIM